MSEQQKLTHWAASAERLRDEVSNLVWLQTTFRRLQAIIEQNPKLRDTPSAFFDFLFGGYAVSAAVGVRRVVFQSGSALCLAKLLKDVAKHPHLVSRAAIQSRYGESFGHKYDELVGHADPLTKNEIMEDLARVESSARAIKHYVDERVAHISTAPKEGVPTYADLSRAIEVLEKMLLKYGFLLTGVTFYNLEQLEQHDILDVLTFPWYSGDT
jgi:hypothetical protein